MMYFNSNPFFRQYELCVIAHELGQGLHSDSSDVKRS